MKIIHQSLGDLHNKLSISTLGDATNDAKNWEEITLAQGQRRQGLLVVASSTKRQKGKTTIITPTGEVVLFMPY